MTSSQSHRWFKHKRPVVSLCCLFLCSLAGCIEIDPGKSVTVIVTDLENKTEQEEVIKILETMYDKDARSKRYKSVFDAGRLTVQMQPVTDVDAFSRRINFGTVTEVSGRTIKVTYVRSRSTLQI